MSDRGFPESLLPGSGASYNSRYWTNSRSPVNDSQHQSPVSPIDGGFSSDFQNGKTPLDAFPQGNSPQPDGLASWKQDMGRDYRGRERPELNERDGSRSATRAPTKSPGSTSRLCRKCNESLTGQFVRALGGTFHLECFKCNVSLLMTFSLF
jgi:hypothetical protein